jgi:hypothetical protein
MIVGEEGEALGREAVAEEAGQREIQCAEAEVESLPPLE